MSSTPLPGLCAATALFLFSSSLQLAMAQQSEREIPKPGRFVIVIHGGAIGDVANMKPEIRAAAEQTLRQALTTGTSVLEKNGRSLDAVEQVIRFLEDDPTFNAGRGAVFNAAGAHELDASIMDGATRKCGAVAAVRTVKNPISLARLVMIHTPHILFTSDGAEQFATEMRVERVENKYFSTPERHEEWQKAKAKISQEGQGDKKGTVGCVALDNFGHIAAGTSTGGLTNKMFGRVGDSPIIGAGTYADDQTCGVSCTGIGEQFIRHSVAYDVSARMKYGNMKVTDAVKAILTESLKPNDGGIIAIGRDGELTMQFNTQGMARAAADGKGRFEVVVGGDFEK